jgi:predicted amidohydrolase YtcJ
VDADGLNRLVRLLDGRGWQVSIETDSPEEADEARTAFAHAVRSNSAVVRERRHRLEHQDGIFTVIGKTKAIGSDWPRGPLAPMRVLQSALAYLALNDALRAYTFGGAFASYDEKRKGTLEAGMLADIVVLSGNIFEMEPAQLDTVKVAYTIFDGRIVYPADRRSTTFP